MMIRQPVVIPPKRGIYALVNGKRKFVYVAFTQNLQKRSHSMSHMLMNYDADKKCYWPIRELPKHPSDEFTFMVLATGVAPERALSAIAIAQKGFLAKKYAIVSGHRAGSPIVTVDGKKQTLAEALAEHNRKLKYTTVYRRLQRGWTARQALGLDEPDARWNHKLQEARHTRAERRAA